MNKYKIEIYKNFNLPFLLKPRWFEWLGFWEHLETACCELSPHPNYYGFNFPYFTIRWFKP